MTDTSNTAEAMAKATRSPVFTPAEAAMYLNLGELGVPNPVASVRYLVKTGKLQAIKVLGRLAFLEEDLSKFLMNQQQEAKRNGKR